MKISRAAAAALVAASLFAMPFGAANAAQSDAQELAPIKVSVKTAAGKGTARFDWLAHRNPNPQPATRAVVSRSLGNGSWVCSPAGFGRKARCSQR